MGGFIYGINCCLILALAIMWVALPVIVLSKFNELLELQREMLKLHYELRNQLRGPLKDEKASPPLPL